MILVYIIHSLEINNNDSTDFVNWIWKRLSSLNLKQMTFVIVIVIP